MDVVSRGDFPWPCPSEQIKTHAGNKLRRTSDLLICLVERKLAVAPITVISTKAPFTGTAFHDRCRFPRECCPLLGCAILRAKLGLSASHHCQPSPDSRRSIICRANKTGPCAQYSSIPSLNVCGYSFGVPSFQWPARCLPYGIGLLMRSLIDGA
ncbi:hypothetical protein K493DRAFT_321061 [Basidiobolus meristosporus CBS 931.73]|uniref:Uncharacterized protein n=1 Tax=Basidiobolus meristosporus CBS 931.73 TaxID=1314790 RepID=A0A1Y1X0U7_9FUNG|nr:hypothetical protein K493DRAFT_321061 [Basidiobolus meristosporus CBS 931.73]|eukprot:ORX79431.1 hypothetical protein K493DRAFT_321061 [Basidiobolus meristosporus CBS 931.73]